MTTVAALPTQSEVAVPDSTGNGDLVVSIDDVPIYAQPTPTRQLVAELPEVRRRIAAGARRAVATTRDATAWLALGLADVAGAARNWGRRSRYRGRHQVQSYWFGRERSTAEQTGYLHRTYRLRAARDHALTSEPSPEGELPGRPTESIYWVGWLERLVELARGDDEVLHPAMRHRCS